MKQWFSELSARERLILIMGGAASIVMLVYTLAWHPFQGRYHAIKEELRTERGDLVWMHQAARQVKQLAGNGSSVQKTSSDTPLMTLADSTARSAGLESGLKRVEPLENRQVKVRLEAVAFDDVLGWLSMLENEHGIQIINASIEKKGNAGSVNALLTLSEASQ